MTKISTRQVDGVTILEPRGKLTIGVGDVALRDAVHQALDGGARNLLVDMSNVTAMDSSSVGELVSAYTTVTNRGGKLKLLNLPAKVNDILQITQLITVFETYDDEDEAVRSFPGA
ncbi:MAG TPA: STAS domain-containing protein [Thermoanaerobaculia bacterium]|nr:STAS domain-containing protein [Thermoanaerobaculia bacterium]